jgi:hypothetical protein
MIAGLFGLGGPEIIVFLLLGVVCPLAVAGIVLAVVLGTRGGKKPPPEDDD